MKRIDTIVPVDWYDGLELCGALFDHTDARTAELSALALRVTDRPGVLLPRGTGPTTSQLVTLASVGAQSSERDLQISIAREFVIVAPSGRVIPCSPCSPRDPEPIRLGTVGPGEDLLILCGISDRQQSPMEIPASRKSGEELELRWPCLTLRSSSRAEYRNRALQFDTDEVAVARLVVPKEGGAPSQDLRFIPPVVHCGTAGAFDEGILPRIQQSYHHLLRYVSSNINRLGGPTGAVVGSDTGLARRRADYELLRMLLVANVGWMRSLGDLSPLGFCRQCVQPLARWWLDYRDAAFPDTSSPTIDKLTGHATALDQLERADLLCGTRSLLDATAQYLSAMESLLEQFA